MTQMIFTPVEAAYFASIASSLSLNEGEFLDENIPGIGLVEAYVFCMEKDEESGQGLYSFSNVKYVSKETQEWEDMPCWDVVPERTQEGCVEVMLPQ